MALLARGSDDRVAPTAWRAVFVATGITGVVVALVDVVENTAGHVVVATDGDVAAGVLGAIRSLNWLVAGLIGVVFVGGSVVVGVRWFIRSLRGS